MNTGFFAGNNKKTKPILKLFFYERRFFMSKFRCKNPHPDGNPKDKFSRSRSVFPPDLSSVFARIDPLPPSSPMYTNSLSNEIDHYNTMKQLPIAHFEQKLDEKDLNSIQL